MSPEEFKKALQRFGYDLSDQQMKQFEIYFEFLIATNENVNLTAITDKKDVYLKHFYDSVTPLLETPTYFADSASICDVGAGAGFPSLPIKILRPDLKITIVDSLNKRITFLNELVARLNLTDIALIHDRAETFGNKRSEYRGKFDIVTARAVARLSVLSELCIPLVKKGGYFIALKAANSEKELTEGEGAISVLGGKVIENRQFELPVDGDVRNLIVVNKTRQTPNKYPRKPGTPNKEPIGS